LRGVRQQQDEPGRFSICSRQAAVVQRCDAVIGEWAWSSKSIALTAQTLSISGLHGRFFV
ncbi:hypothetical protein, partial [Escherichia coli]|uniref:hypothetical protein n=1 Tax=Escherichia coli TaxID=562 RepID=UPI003AF78DF6